MKNLLIGLSGLAGSGKDTAALALVDAFDGDVLAFADPIKRIARDVYGFSDRQLWGPSEARNAVDPSWNRPDGTCLSPREACQIIGTEMGRRLHPDTWVRYAIRVARALLDQKSNAQTYVRNKGLVGTLSVRARDVYISDVRFPNEIAAIRAEGGFVYRIIRDGSGLGGSAGLHPSEQALMDIPNSDFDAVILNNGTIEELRAQICSLVARERNHRG